MVAALSFPHLASSCKGFRPLRFTASASSSHSVKSVLTTVTCPSLTATCNALSPSAFTASKLILFYEREREHRISQRYLQKRTRKYKKKGYK